MFVALAVLTFVSANSRQLFGQLPDDQRSVLAFDVYFDRILSSEMVESTGIDEFGGQMTNKPSDQIDLDTVRRIFGAASAPASLETLKAIQGGAEQTGFSFFARMQFKDKNGADKAFAKMEEGSAPATIGNKECFRPPVGAAPSNIAFYRLSPDVIEIGSDDYLELADRNVFSANLMDAWSKMPKAAIRVGVDLDGARHLVDEALQMAGSNIPPMAQPALSMVNNMAVLRIGMDFSGDTLLWLTATGKDASATGQINATLGGLLAMAKGMGAQTLPMAGPDAQGPGGELLAALATTVDGNDVNIVLPRPEGLEKAIGGAMAQMMSMGSPPMVGEQPGAAANADPFGGDPFGGDGGAEPAPAAEKADDPFGGDGADPFGN
jgi:hypothetical protein